jgi:3-oxoacyl-[acyl-carrier-protein] synthase-3
VEVRVSGTGSYIPFEEVTNEELERGLDTSAKWIEERLGIKTRYLANKDQRTSDLATEAAWSALMDANMTAESMDLIIVATATPDMLTPSTATIVQEKLGAYQAAAFDMNAVCTGFVYAFVTGAQFIKSGMYERVLIIGADTFSQITDWTKRSAVFFGDGAGAVVLEAVEGDSDVLASNLYADGTGRDAFITHHGHFFEMDNKAVYDTASVVLPDALLHTIEDAGLLPFDVDFVVPHQPSIHILRSMARKAGIPFEKVMTNMDKYGNTSAGSVPIMLDETAKGGLLKRGDIVAMVAVGSGWTWGASVIRW